MYAEYYHRQLMGSGKLDWLVKQRRIGLRAIRAFRLGYVGAPAVEAHQRYTGMLVIPYLDAYDHERTLRFRSFNGGPKYFSLPGARSHLFAVRYSEESKVYITEGELDAITIWQTKRRAVGVPGSTSWKDHWRWLFRSCDEVVVVFDGDEAGKRGTAKILQSLQTVAPYVRAVEMPEGSDVNDVFRSSRSHLEELLG